MTTVRNTEPATTPHDSIELELDVEGVMHSIEFAADETRAFTVGSLLLADLRIDRPGVAPVHFHVEREGHEVWIVPAYGANDLRVDAARVTRPKAIRDRAVIEFSSVRVGARVLRRGSMHITKASTEAATLDWVADDTSPKASEVRRDEASEPFSPAGLNLTVPAQKMIAIEPPQAPGVHSRKVELSSGSNGIAAGTSRNSLAHDTIETAPFWVPEPVASVETQCIDLAKTTRFEPIRISNLATRAPNFAAALSTTQCDILPTAPNPGKAASWLIDIGRLSKHKPVHVWFGGTLLIFALSASLAMFVKHFRQPPATHAHTLNPIATSALSARISGLHTEIAGLNAEHRSGLAIEVMPLSPQGTRQSAKKGQAAEPELVAAVGHLIAGRYSDAQRAYAHMASRSPVDPPFVAMSRLLAKRVDARCAGSVPKLSLSCPEVKP